MNVKYASDTYWSEKMAANYYSLDKALGLQDYNYYQLGVVTAPIAARTDATSSAKFLYTYPEKDDAFIGGSISGGRRSENTHIVQTSETEQHSLS